MKIIHRKIDFLTDKDYVLEAHCRINYECECPWKRAIPYVKYRKEWFLLDQQINEFYSYLQKTAEDNRTIAEIIESENGYNIGYFWAPFIVNEEMGFCFAEIQDIYIEEQYRQCKIASELLNYAQLKAKDNGAKVIRSGTGCENIKSIKLHEKLGFYQYRVEFEKVL
jgi:ribosomal protein S18 acetylase RimI-like enzyme